nr:atlastin-1 isoform X2 [Crassostrea gigas]
MRPSDTEEMDGCRRREMSRRQISKKMERRDDFEKGEPLQIIKVTDKKSGGDIIHGLELNEENLKRILLHPFVKDIPVVIISITGAFRKGKSFLLGFFLKFLEAQESVWLKENDKIKGFEWRGGTERVTSGILIWSKPFICQDKFGEKFAVLLMDTQGIFDRESTMNDSARIFALSSLMSTVQIYNIMQQLQEDDLKNLKFFTEFGKLGTETFSDGEFNMPKLVFLIRDWGCPYEYPYGEDGGKNYVTKILEETTEQPKELKDIRRAIKKCFPDVCGFLLPHPGKAVVTKKMFDGQVKEMDDDFVEYVELLVQYIFLRNMLVTKKMNGRELKGEDLMMYMKAMAAVHRQRGIRATLDWYKHEMIKVFPKNKMSVPSDEDFENTHKILCIQAKERLRKYPGIQLLGNLFECEIQLEEQISQVYVVLKNTMEKRKEVIKKIDEGVAMFSGAALLAGVATVGAFIVKHIK